VGEGKEPVPEEKIEKLYERKGRKTLQEPGLSFGTKKREAVREKKGNDGRGTIAVTDSQGGHSLSG